MSANNQTLVKKYKDKYYVFSNIQAESWSEKNELSIKEARDSFSDLGCALIKAFQIDKEDDDFMDGTEYGVWEDVLCKDGAGVTLTD